MSEAALDRILNKYDRKLSKPIIDIEHTQRKQQRRERDITFMDQQYTPNKNSNNIDSQLVLRCLDQTQKKLAISERNYAEICRKFQRAKQMCEHVSQELQKQRTSRLQELIDLQNKLHLLEKDNVKSKTVIEAKDHNIAILREKLKQKEEQTKLFEEELEQISHKLHSTMQLKDQQSINIIQKQITISQEESHRSLIILKQKYEEQITQLKRQVQNFDKVLIQKERQKRGLLDDMEELTKNHQIELQQVKKALIKNQQTYQSWLDAEKKQKMVLVEKYEERLRETKRNQFMDRIKETQRETQELGKGTYFVQNLEKEIEKLQQQIKNYKVQIATLVRADQSNLNKIAQLQEQLKQVKYQYFNQTNESKQMLAKLKKQEQTCREERRKNIQLQSKMEEINRKCEEVISENGQLQRENINLKDHMTKQLKNLVGVRKQLSEATDSQLNMNSTLTQMTAKMKLRIKQLEQQLEVVTTDLYAERLEKAKVRQQFEESKVQLKKQYELSMENTRKQLQQKIKQSMKDKMDSRLMDPEKQKLYLQMFRVQRQYELLKSQVVTADQMLRMGTKMTKYYEKRSK